MMRRIALLSVCLFALLMPMTTWAFPTNAVLDTFDRANEGPPPTGWAGPIWNGDHQLKIISNLLQQDTLPGGDIYWNSSFSADQEVYAIINNLPLANSGVSFYLRVASPHTGSETFIEIAYTALAGTDTIDVLINQAETNKLTINQEVSAGDSIGASVVGNLITVYYKAAAGSWGSIGSVSDGTVTGAGFIGIGFGGSAGGVTANDFGGGSLSAAGPDVTPFYKRRVQ